jgi:hypothetical protein
MGETFDAKIDRRKLLIGLAAGLNSGAAATAQMHNHPAPLPADIHTKPRYFSASQFHQLSTICQLIIPADGSRGGAIEAGVPEFIDLLTSENKDYQRQLSGGLQWLDALCAKRFETSLIEATAAQQRQLLDTIAFRANAASDPSALAGVEFFAFLRDLTLDGFFTSKIGIEYLDFRGNHALISFEGCPGTVKIRG